MIVHCIQNTVYLRAYHCMVYRTKQNNESSRSYYLLVRGDSIHFNNTLVESSNNLEFMWLARKHSRDIFYFCLPAGLIEK